MGSKLIIPPEPVWGVVFLGSEDEPQPGICVEENRLLVFVGEDAEKRTRLALVDLLAGKYGWKPADPSLYKAMALTMSAQETSLPEPLR